MKKYLLFFLCLVLLVGCSNQNKSILKKFDNKINNLKSYHLKGTLSISRGDDLYTYDVDSSYLADDYYRVSLINNINNHEQIILRNKTGVYVLNPTINKSYKFESNWPYNNSGIYLLQTIIRDIKDDDDRIIKKNKAGYTIKSKVKYINNSNIDTQIVYLDKDLNVIKVDILDKNDNVVMNLVVDSFDINTKYDTNYFSLKSNCEDSTLEKTVSEIDEIIYPMYLPANTYLTNQEKIKTDDYERVIMNFDGDNSFVLIEETINIPDELETSLVDGEPDIILDTVGFINDYSVSWISNGIEYYLISNDMDTKQMMSVASSINVIAVGK